MLKLILSSSVKVVFLAYKGNVYKNNLIHIVVSWYINNKYPKGEKLPNSKKK